MEVILFIIIASFAWTAISSWLQEPQNTERKTPGLSETKNPYDVTTVHKPEVITDYKNGSSSANSYGDNRIVNNYYVQNNVYVQYNTGKKRSDDSKDHSKAVWERMGYRVRTGEKYAYKMYGNEIFLPSQVEKIGYNRETLQLEYGLSKNQKKVKQLGYALVNKVGSKRKAKDILVNAYDFDEDTAKYAVGYYGYDNW